MLEFAMTLYAAAAAAAPQADRPAFDDLPRGVRARVRVEAPCDAAYGIVADHEAYPEFMPGIRGVKTVRKGSGWADVAFRYQRGEGAVQHRTYAPPQSIRWRLLEGDTDQVRSMSGFWGFSALEGQAAACQVTYELHVEPKLPVPGAVVSRFLRPIAQRAIEAAARRIESGGTWKNPER